MIKYYSVRFGSVGGQRVSTSTDVSVSRPVSRSRYPLSNPENSLIIYHIYIIIIYKRQATEAKRLVATLVALSQPKGGGVRGGAAAFAIDDDAVHVTYI